MAHLHINNDVSLLVRGKSLRLCAWQCVHVAAAPAAAADDVVVVTVFITHA